MWSRRFKVGAAAAAMAARIPGPLTNVFGGIAASLGALGFASDALAQDPPSPAYDRRTVARPWRLDETVVGAVTTPQAFPAVMLGLNRVNAEIRALVRAYERAQGAAMRGARAYVEPRLEEARAFSHSASQTLGATGPATVELANQLPPLGDEAAGSLTAPHAPSELSEPALSFLYRAGIPIEQLRQTLAAAARAARQERPGTPEETLRAAGLGMSDLALVLADWRPEGQLFGS